ncbi:OLC1v1009299C1 [Oldenlandia corymbosa var. corymbosa]|uniref:OLC1v1009299C1 n=1 Tax=Oldenlandia corymbosa var. corymbosa TaxID=529605 RepID=A0AAV1DR35_OLDCO|nr:OLC1v1009299C1 [Oldenlandia corymbosa var. corymbosa]
MKEQHRTSLNEGRKRDFVADGGGDGLIISRKTGRVGDGTTDSGQRVSQHLQLSDIIIDCGITLLQAVELQLQMEKPRAKLVMKQLLDQQQQAKLKNRTGSKQNRKQAGSNAAATGRSSSAHGKEENCGGRGRRDLKQRPWRKSSGSAHGGSMAPGLYKGDVFSLSTNSWEPLVLEHDDDSHSMHGELKHMDYVVHDGSLYWLATFDDEDGVISYTLSKPLIVKPWDVEKGLKYSNVEKAPVWIRLYGLELKYWHENSMSRLASSTGVPLQADEYTVSKSRVQYARILVEMEISETVPDKSVFEDECGILKVQKVAYEWIPTKCNQCLEYGHGSEKCRKLVGKVDTRVKEPAPVWRRVVKGKHSNMSTRTEWVSTDTNKGSVANPSMKERKKESNVLANQLNLSGSECSVVRERCYPVNLDVPSTKEVAVMQSLLGITKKATNAQVDKRFAENRIGLKERMMINPRPGCSGYKNVSSLPEIEETQFQLRKLNRAEYDDIVEKALKDQCLLSKMQKELSVEPLNVELQEEERELYKQYLESSKAANGFLQQKEKAKCITEGDQNMRYFHSLLSTMKSNIWSVYIDDGEEINDRTGIEDHFVQF